MDEAKFLAVVEQIYGAALNGRRWPDALAAIAELFSGIDATLEIHDLRNENVPFMRYGRRLLKENVEKYVAYYAGVSPRTAWLAATRQGQVSHDYDLISESEMDRDEFYADFLGRHDLRYFLSGTLANEDDTVSLVSVQRTPRQGHVDEDDVAAMRRLIPHIGQALDLHLRIAGARRATEDLDATLDRLHQGVALLDRRGRVISLNRAAARMMEAGDGCRLIDRHLSLDDPIAHRRLGRIMGRLFRDGSEAPVSVGGVVIVRRPLALPPFVLSVRRLPDRRGFPDGSEDARLVLFLEDPAKPVALDAASLASAFGLTAMEANLALALLRGETLRQHAEARGVKTSTIRSHLKRLMHKTGAHRQVDLVRLLVALSAAAP